MIADKIKELVSNSEFSQTQKIGMIGFVERAAEYEIRKGEDRKLIREIFLQDNLSEVVFSTDEVKIYKVIGKGEWEIKYPFRSIYVNKKGEWERISIVSPTLDMAYLVYLQHKHIGLNSQFAEFATKMLGIPDET
jgi:hypothetical protein